MATYAQMISKILGEIEHDSFTAEVSAAIHDAIAHYEDDHNYFATTRATFPLEPNDEYVPLPSDFIELDAIKITYGDNTYPLEIRTPEWLDDHFPQTSTTIYGPPTDCAPYAQDLRLQLATDQTATLEMRYRYKVAAPLSGSESNVWTNELKNLIKYRAKWAVYLNDMHDPEMAAPMKSAEMEAFAKAEERREKQTGAGKITPTEM